MTTAKLILIRGLPGSGKSTQAKKLIEESITDSVSHYEADMFHINEDGVYEFNPENIGRAHAWCRTKAFNDLDEDKTVIVSNTFTKLKEMKPYLEYAEQKKIPILVLRMMNDFGSIHNVPETTLEKMRNRFVDYPGEFKITIQKSEATK